MKTLRSNKSKTIELLIDNRVVQVERKKIKNMYLRVRPPQGSIHISAPIRTHEDSIRAFVHAKQEWITMQLERIQENRENNPRNPYSEPLTYRSGDSLHLWGKEYLLSVEYLQQKNQVLRGEDDILLMVKKSEDTSTTEERKTIIIKWYRQILNDEIPLYMHQWENIIGVKANSFTIRDMKTRWGTCNIRDKKICLNLQLVKKSPEGLEYVIVHELVHLLERSHNQVFKAYMTKFLPDWKERKYRLNYG